jgi:hypothetical protein
MTNIKRSSRNNLLVTPTWDGSDLYVQSGVPASYLSATAKRV